MRRVKINERNIGVMYHHSGTKIRVWAPMAKEVSMTLQREGSFTLSKEEHGYWSGTVSAQPGELYHFMVDGTLLPDPASLSQPEGVHGPSQVYDAMAYPWTDRNWINPSIDKYIFYELHTGTFTPTGTFREIESKLDHLIALGITAIEIMPVAQFSGVRNWGYDGVFPFAVQNSYGGPIELQRLVDKCHSKGIAVVLDVVYNHLGPEGNSLPAYGPYLTDKYKTPWGKAINFDDEWSDAVRDYFIENALMWFRDFHIDALRLDAVHSIYDFSAKHILKEIKEYADELMTLTGRTHYIIVESDLNDRRYIDETGKGGYNMDAQWNDQFHHALRVCAGNASTGYYSDFSGVQHLAKSYLDAYVQNGSYSAFRKKTFGSDTAGIPGSRFVVFSQNHDQVGNRLQGERTSTLVSFEMQKLLAGAVMISPYLPLLFMGEEWGATQPFQYFTHHTDETIATSVREGRQKEHTHYTDCADCPDPQAQDTFIKCKLRWEDTKQACSYLLIQYYTRLIAIRKILPALYLLNRNNIAVEANEQTKTLALYRWHGSEHVVCIMNFSDKTQTVHLPWSIPNLDKLFDSASPEWGGPGESNTSGIQTHIQPKSLAIFNNQNV